MALDEPYVSAIKKFEGFTPKAKWDYKQWSGGYGTRAQPGQVFDEKQADGMLRGELGQARDLVRKFRPDLQPGQEAALTSLTFNAGNKWMSSGLGQAVKAGDWNTASQRLQQYTRAGGEVLPGLVKRRQQEAQWLTGGGMLAPAVAPPPMGLGGPAQGAAAPPATTGMWTPDEVNARRRMAGGMIQEGMSTAPVQHWTQGLARVIGGLSGNMWMDQANKAQREGMAAGAQTMQDAVNGGDPKAAVGGMLANPWTQDQGQRLATGMLSQRIQSQSPEGQAAAALAQEKLKALQFDNQSNVEMAPLKRQMMEAQVKALGQKDVLNEAIAGMLGFPSSPQQPQQAPASPIRPQSMEGPVTTDPNIIKTQAGGMLTPPAHEDDKIDTPLGRMTQQEAQRKGFALGLMGKGDAGKMLVESAQTNKLGKDAQNELDKSEINYANQYGRLREVASTFKPEYLQLPTRLGMWGTQLQARFSSLKPQDQEALYNYATFRRDAASNLNILVKERSGGAVTPQEFERQGVEIPNAGNGIFDGDDPVTFKAKMDRGMEVVALGMARNRYLRSMDPKNAKLPTAKLAEMMPIEQMRGIVNQRAKQIEAEVKASTPGISQQMLDREVDMRIKKEFGI